MVTVQSELEALVRRCLKQAQDANNVEGIKRWSQQLETIELLKRQRQVQIGQSEVNIMSSEVVYV